MRVELAVTGQVQPTGRYLLRSPAAQVLFL
jgi:hypothetical protein